MSGHLIGQHFQGHRVNRAARMAACAAGLEAILPEVVHDDFRHDAAGGIPGADEQHVVDFLSMSDAFGDRFGQVTQAFDPDRLILQKRYDRKALRM